MNKENLSVLRRIIVGCAVLSLFVLTVGRTMAQDDNKPWVAPDAAKAVKNPVPATPENIAAAQMTFTNNCVLCHGEKGMGDGPGAKTIKVKPANFTDAKMMSAETDGSLFWKMSEGRGPMPSWKEDLSEKERWQLVNYLRKLTKDANSK